MDHYNPKKIFMLFFIYSMVANLAGDPKPDFLSRANSHFEFTSSNLPIIGIDTHGKEIVDPYRIEADLGIIYNGKGQRNFLSDPFNHYNGKIGIEIRGSTAAAFPKKPYRFETHDSLGNDLNVSLLGMPAENDWVLYNPFSDKALIRNVLAYQLSNDIGRYASRTKLCEVVLNGKYQGVYVLMEKLKRDRNRVAISAMDSADIAGDALTGGYIIKIDKTAGEQVGGWISNKRVRYQYHYPKPSDIVPAQEQYIQQFMDAFEQVMSSDYYADPDSGYSKYIDLDSFVDYFILNEVSRNIDGYRLSAFMYKDRDSKQGKLTMGPVWDFNLSFGNADYYDGYKVDGWNLAVLLDGIGGDAFQTPFWWRVLGEDAQFQSRLSIRWWELRNNQLDVNRLLRYIDALADTLEEAQQRNFEIWPILGYPVWPNYFVGETFAEEIEFLKEWLVERIEWLDQQIPLLINTAVSADRQPLQPEFSLEQNFPNPFNSTTLIKYYLPVATRVQIKIFNMLGQEVIQLMDTFQTAGAQSIIWDGTCQNGEIVPSGVYACQVIVGSQVKMRKMLYIQ